MTFGWIGDMYPVVAINSQNHTGMLGMPCKEIILRLKWYKKFLLQGLPLDKAWERACTDSILMIETNLRQEV